MKIKTAFTLLFIALFCTNLTAQDSPIVVAADRADQYLYMLDGKTVAVMANHATTTSSGEHLVDFLHSSGVNLKYIFAPEHGFRGTADAGEYISNGRDESTGVEVISLYGKSKRPSDEIMKGIDVVVFDLQDVGVRYYTYLSSLHYILEAAAQNGKEVIVLDRPNPNGFYTDGPIRDDNHVSFVAIYPVPIVHGMTLGELAKMAQGEGWYKEAQGSKVTVVACEGYSRFSLYELPINPSPNLKDMKSIYLYPSICPFEGTPLSLGRGTDFPFLAYGHPKMNSQSFSFTPRPTAGAKNPPLNGVKCYGVDLREMSDDEILDGGFTLKYIIDAYERTPLGQKFFTNFFDTLLGVSYVREMIIEGKSHEQISAVWQDEVKEFKERRKKYLIYE